MTSSDDSADRRDADTVALLEEHLPRVTPPADLFDRILDEVRVEATVVPLRRPRSARITGWMAAGAVAAAAVVALAIGISLVDDGGSGFGEPDARAAISSPTDPAVSGTAELHTAAGKVHVSLRQVPPAPDGHHYEVWVLPEGEEAMISVGTFDPSATEDVDLDLALPGDGAYAAVDVSVEEDAGPAAHSDTSWGSGAFS